MAEIYGQLVKAQAENLGSDPGGTPPTGLVWFNTGTSLLKWYDGTAIRVAVDTASAQTLTNKTIAGASNTLTVLAGSQLTGQVPVANGGTALASGTSGGILYYSAAGVLASSGALGANKVVVGGGAGVSPSTPNAVGIGTVTPTSLVIGSTSILDISGSAGNGGNLLLHNTSNATTELSLFAANNGFFIDFTGQTTAANNSLSFRTNNTAASNAVDFVALKLGSTGKNTIGPAAGAVSHDLNGSLNFNTTETIAAGFNGIYRSATNTLVVATNAATRVTITTTEITSTLVQIGPSGSVSAPTYSFTGSTGTGMYSSASNTLAFTTNGTLAATVSSAQLWSFPGGISSTFVNSSVKTNTGNGTGSTNTGVRRFTNNATVGSDITYADSATLGATFTINTTGLYAISYLDRTTGTITSFNLTKNDASGLVGGASNLSNGQLLGQASTPAANTLVTVSGLFFLSSGDVIRCYADTTTNLSTSSLVGITILKIM